MAAWMVIQLGKPNPLLPNEFAIYSIDIEGGISRREKTLVDPKTWSYPTPTCRSSKTRPNWPKESPRPTINNPALVSNQFVLIRAHPSTPFVHAARVTRIMGHAEVRAPRVEFQIAGQSPDAYQRAWLPVDVGDEPPGRPLSLRIAIKTPGARVPLDPENPKAGHSFDATREIRYEFLGTPLENLASLKAAWVSALEQSEPKGIKGTLILNADPGVTFGEVVAVLKAAHTAGIDSFGIYQPEQMGWRRLPLSGMAR